MLQSCEYESSGFQATIHKRRTHSLNRLLVISLHAPLKLLPPGLGTRRRRFSAKSGNRQNESKQIN